MCDSFPWLALSACHSSLPKSSLHSSSSQAPAWPGQSAFTDTHKQPLPSQRAHLLLPAHLCFPLGGGSQPKPVPWMDVGQLLQEGPQSSTRGLLPTSVYAGSRFSLLKDASPDSSFSVQLLFIYQTLGRLIQTHCLHFFTSLSHQYTIPGFSHPHCQPMWPETLFPHATHWVYQVPPLCSLNATPPPKCPPSSEFCPDPLSTGHY